MSRPLFTFLLAGFACLGLAQPNLNGKDQFPQFRGILGLSGSGFGVMADGRPGFRGAMAYSTPIGHTLGKWSIAAGGGVLSSSETFRFFRSEGSGKDISEGNGTGFAVGGFDLGRAGNLAFGFTFLSGLGDNVSHIQYSPVIKGPVQASVGILDLGGSGGSAGTGVPGDEDSSRSAFAAVTGEVMDGAYLTAGVGTRRFQKGFASASAMVFPSVKALVEHDGFGLNLGLACCISSPVVRESWTQSRSRSFDTTMYVGLIRGKHLGWSLAFSF